MKYKVILECDGYTHEQGFSNLSDAKTVFGGRVSYHMLRGDKFSIDLFIGEVDYTSLFWPHECIATVDYDGDKSVLEA